MNVSRPVGAQIRSVDFEFLTADDIRKLSVKNIQNPETFDTLLHPVQGGLYDPALGPIGDVQCSTCHLDRHNCPGHPGCIELPVPVYHLLFLRDILMLLRAKCAYCCRFRISRAQLNLYVCKLRLAAHGLLGESRELDEIVRPFDNHEGESDDEKDHGDDDPVITSLIAKRENFVRKAIKRASRSDARTTQTIDSKTEATVEEQKSLRQKFFKEAIAARTCATCSGVSPTYRKDGFSKIFRLPLSERIRNKMVQAEKKPVNSLVERIKQTRERQDKTGKLSQGPSETFKQISQLDEDVDVDDPNLSPDTAAGDSALGQMDSDSLDGGSGLAKVQEFINVEQARATLHDLFDKEQEILQLLYRSKPDDIDATFISPDIFFVWNLLVPPNKFRPEEKQTNVVTEAQVNSIYRNILKQCQLLDLIRQDLQGGKTSFSKRRSFLDYQNSWIRLQEYVNSLIDSNHSPTRRGSKKPVEEGVRQKLEKKEGLFRMNMMGKRVNFAARSVISPDPNIETNEVGVPPVFARKLTYPEPVCGYNFDEMRQAVMNGPAKWPGASAIENEDGQVISLRHKSFDQRQALANQILAPSNVAVNGARNKKIHRHLQDGDILIMNRQPTLHRPSMMCHRARVLHGEKTIRMHYANCNAYNADFDGDEMNMHFPQNEVARAEAFNIADADNQYLVPTSGKPLRGLIQDHISVSVLLTSRDTFFTRAEYQQLLYSCLRPERGDVFRERIEIVPPALMKPRVRWTGKQIISTILKNLTTSEYPGLSLKGKTQTAGDRWGKGSEEGRVIFDSGELLQGILDKSNLGPANGSFVHGVYEACGPSVAGKLISALGKLLTYYLHSHAFSCGMEDIVLNDEGEATRSGKLREAETLGMEIASNYVLLDRSKGPNSTEVHSRLADVVHDDQKLAGLDKIYNSRTGKLSSAITAACLPAGLRKEFPKNQMQTMTTSGAKGSPVNANLISCNLGQQILEGRRVPLMVSGKTLPSFKPYETKLRAGGYITDRFLTGVKPQEYYFHAMAGREGLIDTAIKTARSGYLQRCVIKGMESLTVRYDTSVRSSDGSLVQFLYGEDGLDVTKQMHLKDFSFLAGNFMSIIGQMNIVEEYPKIHHEAAPAWHEAAMKAVKKSGRIDAMDPVLSRYNPSSTLGSTSESFAMALKAYTRKNPDGLLTSKKDKSEAMTSKKIFSKLMNMKYMKSIVDAGEAVGIVAGQSIGEPSTQMTLNTFHLAGHSAKNVTLGIPRLREILMTATSSIATPTMNLFLSSDMIEEDGRKFAKGISQLTLADVVDQVSVIEKVGKGMSYPQTRTYKIRLDLFPKEDYMKTHAIQVADVLKTLQKGFLPTLMKSVKRDMKSKGGKGESTAMELGKATHQENNPKENKELTEGEDSQGQGHLQEEGVEDSTSEAESEESDNSSTVQGKRSQKGAAYEAPDAEDEEIARQARAESEYADDKLDNEMHDEGYGGSPPLSLAKDTESGAGRNARKVHKKIVQKAHHEVTRFYFDDETGALCDVSLESDALSPKVLMLDHVEAACRNSFIQFIPGLKECVYIPQDDDVPEHYISTDGANLLAMRDYQHIIDPNRLKTNDISAMLKFYGVEAARATIINELRGVFESHSIQVDTRHLSLIADFMTRGGGFIPFSRSGIRTNSSPFAKMSFETTMDFLKSAVIEGDWDDLQGPSSKLVLGKLSAVGTGSFDVFTKLQVKRMDT